jgi:hypothetical protein
VHWLSRLQPSVAEAGNTGPGPVPQLIWLVSFEFTRNELIEPFPGVTPSAAVVGLRFSPPPLNMKVRMEGCSKMIPPPPRSRVLPLPRVSHANPARGESVVIVSGIRRIDPLADLDDPRS